MSTMLEQAIVDAEALREAALKSAENSILEKYAGEVKNTLNTILEQEEDELGLGDVGLDMGPDMGNAETGMDDVPLAATDGENLCACPDDEEEIEIDFAELEKQMASEEEPEGHEELGDDLGLDMDLGADDEEIELSEDIIKELLSEDGEEAVEEEIKEEEEVNEGGDITSCEGEATPEKSQETRASVSDIKTESLIKEATSEVLKLAEGQNKKILTEKKQLQNKVSKLLKENKEIKSENENFRTTIQKMSEKMEEVNVSNAKLYYTNRILKSDSLNERQKQAIAEAISEAGSVDEAKVIYETLQNTVPTLESKRGPKSLREAVSRNSTILTMPRREKPKKNDAIKDRFQQLAGLK